MLSRRVKNKLVIQLVNEKLRGMNDGIMVERSFVENERPVEVGTSVSIPSRIHRPASIAPHFSRDIIVRVSTLKSLSDKFSRDAITKYFIEEDIFYDGSHEVLCPNQNFMKLTWNSDRDWRCHIPNCPPPCSKTKVNVRLDSFFTLRKTLLEDQFLLYLWLVKASKQTIMHTTGLHPQTVSKIINDFYQVLQEDLGSNDTEIGGPGIIVEIDESKFGKRKYHRGHRVEGVWVVGGVERTPERKCFMVTVENRNAATMFSIITRFVKAGSIIHTDFWRAYNGIVEWNMNYEHRSVNHSEGFISAEGTHTNTIEGTWNGIKIRCFPRSRTRKNVPWVLAEFIWRRKHHGDLYNGLITTVLLFNS